MKAKRLGLCWVLAALCVGGLAASAQTMSGFAHGELALGFWGTWPESIEIESELGIEYAIDAWSFGALLTLAGTDLEDLAFLAEGSLGAVSVYSLYWLWPSNGPNWLPGGGFAADWENAFWMNIGGVEMWSFFSLNELDAFGTFESGAGLAIGGHGTAGGVEIWAQTSFNLVPNLAFIYWNGFESTVDQNLACDLIEVAYPTCALGFTYAEAYIDFPFCCAEATAWIGFDCLGFDGVEFWTRELAIGETALSLEWVGLWFGLDAKEVGLWFDLDIGHTACIEPFVTLDMDDMTVIDGLEIDALELACTVGDVSVRIAELFSMDDFYLGIDGAIHPVEPLVHWIIPAQCVEPMYDAKQAIAIEIDRTDDCCCGTSFGLYNFFDPDLDGVLFDWLGLRARVVSSASSSVSMYLETWIGYDGVEAILFGFDYTWGTLRALTNELDCCLLF